MSMTEYEIHATLTYTEAVAPLELADRAEELLEAIEAHAGDLAISPAVAADWSKASIDIIYNVQAADDSDADRKAGALQELLAKHTPSQPAALRTAPPRAVCA